MLSLAARPGLSTLLPMAGLTVARLDGNVKSGRAPSTVPNPFRADPAR
jgi:hypothetical protein